MLLITGATGFVGNAVVARAAMEHPFSVRVAVRTGAPEFQKNIETAFVGDMTPETDWRNAVRGVDTIVHAAARVHVMRDSAVDPLAEFRRVNVAGTLNLARQAVDAGVRRFIFISSIKVNGESTLLNRPYTAADVPAPVDPYGISKYEAEFGLTQLAEKTGLEMVIIRPVLVYGPGVRANFLSMMRWLYRGIPLPLGAIHNRRSLVALDNLVDLITICLYHPAAANQVFLVSDGEDLSTTALLRRASAALGRPGHLIPVPALALRWTARLLGKVDFAQRLCGSLQVDISKTQKFLGWVPPLGIDDALRQTAQHFLANLHRR
ncbi:MAG TPA: SDR family oxidoreductase [Opitutaceae bacterium]|jgi:nucleoside-diphosphate-sugar epimerase|nr:SDR family oxidoreductase [Opitutaceae bacterium]